MEKKIRICVAAITGVLIIVFGIIFKQPFIKMLPFLISIFVMMLQGKANRYGFLTGALNSIIYIYVYWLLGAYSTMAYVLLFSCPVQFFTFFNWQKHSYKKSVTFKKMSKKLRIFTAVVYVLAWVCVYIVLKMLKSEVAVLDTTSSLIGVLVSLLTAFAYIEYSYLWIVGTVVGLFLNIQLAFADIANITLVVSGAYNLYCSIMAFITVKKLYQKQKEEGLAE